MVPSHSLRHVHSCINLGSHLGQMVFMLHSIANSFDSLRQCSIKGVYWIANIQSMQYNTHFINLLEYVCLWKYHIKGPKNDKSLALKEGKFPKWAEKSLTLISHFCLSYRKIRKPNLPPCLHIVARIGVQFLQKIKLVNIAKFKKTRCAKWSYQNLPFSFNENKLNDIFIRILTTLSKPHC